MKKIIFKIFVCVFVLTLTSSCADISKRRYRSGYHIEWLNKKGGTSPSVEREIRDSGVDINSDQMASLKEKVVLDQPRIKFESDKDRIFKMSSSKKKSSLVQKNQKSIAKVKPSSKIRRGYSNEYSQGQKVLLTVLAIFGLMGMLLLSLLLSLIASTSSGFIFPEPNIAVFLIAAIGSFVAFIFALKAIWGKKGDKSSVKATDKEEKESSGLGLIISSLVILLILWIATF